LFPWEVVLRSFPWEIDLRSFPWEVELRSFLWEVELRRSPVVVELLLQVAHLQKKTDLADLAGRHWAEARLRIWFAELQMGAAPPRICSEALLRICLAVLLRICSVVLLRICLVELQHEGRECGAEIS